MAALDTRTGQVTKVNHTGFQLDGTDWVTISKFADPAPEMPSVGQRVTVGVDTKGFARTVEQMSTDSTIAKPSSGSTVPKSHDATLATRDAMITRLAVLKVAATFAASRPDMKSPDLIALAERLEAWVTR